jgi:hypothetical protein
MNFRYTVMLWGICVTIVAVGKTTMHCVCFFVELHVTVNRIRLLTVAQQCIYGKFNSSAIMKRTHGVI